MLSTFRAEIKTQTPLPPLNQVPSSKKQVQVGANLRVVPVEGEPVEAFQLVFPECVAVSVFPGALQLFPVGCRRPILQTHNVG